MPNALTYKYPYAHRREQNLFVEEYYCSTDTKILIDDIEQTEISYINYSLQEQLKPLYGYASNTFDDVAIGNRIVTGMFKVPIKNPEAQADIDMVYAEGIGDYELSAYNEAQEALKRAIEWINNNGSGTTTGAEENSSSTHVQHVNDEEFEYLKKLAALGYDLKDDSLIIKFMGELKMFQNDNGLEQNGVLNESTKNKIDELFDESQGELIDIPAGTEFYSRPDENSPSRTITKSCRAKIMDTSFSGWKQVKPENNINSYWIKE